MFPFQVHHYFFFFFINQNINQNFFCYFASTVEALFRLNLNCLRPPTRLMLSAIFQGEFIEDMISYVMGKIMSSIRICAHQLQSLPYFGEGSGGGGGGNKNNNTNCNNSFNLLS